LGEEQSKKGLTFRSAKRSEPGMKRKVFGIGTWPPRQEGDIYQRDPIFSPWRKKVGGGKDGVSATVEILSGKRAAAGVPLPEAAAICGEGDEAIGLY